MNRNLKNRPKWSGAKTINQNKKAIEDWFEGFEKELRKLENITYVKVGHKTFVSQEEILGE